MGLSLEFYAGDAEVIGAAITALELDGLRNGTLARANADFSLHLSPTDLDLLSEVAAEQAGVRPLLLNDSLVATVGGNGTDHGAEEVSPNWVRMIATIDQVAVPELASAWIARVAEEHGEPLTVAPDTIRAVAELIRLCRMAEQQGLAVVHVWYL